VRTGSGALSYLPAFFVGAVIAVRLDAVRNFADRVNTRKSRHLFWFVAAFGGAMLMIAPWLFGPGIADMAELTHALKGLAPLGAAAIVVSAIGWAPLRALFESRPLQFAGTISFSLYLVHVPIIIFSTYLFAGAFWYVPLLFAVPVAILVATGFTWLVEKRSHGWSRAVGAWASERYRASFGRSEQSEGAPNAVEPPKRASVDAG
jgi:peptidoglycan/LPS O-acetylase OafA/YrhL